MGPNEISWLLQAASATSPAAICHPPDTAVRGLDDNHRHAVTAITSSAQTVQPLQLHPGADKTGTLAAIADTAHHHNNRVLALPATPAAAQYAAHNRYADTTTTAAHARTQLENKQWKLPPATLVIVDDADQLQPQQLVWLTESAAATNTKLILITTPDSRQPGHNLLSVLAKNLLSTQHLGNPESQRPQSPTAIERVEHHLAATNATSTTRNHAAQLLHQRNQILDRLRDIANTAAQIDTAAARQHDRERNRDRDHGLEL
jgi:AAA domain